MCASLGVMRFIRGYALWSKMVMLGVVRGLCADFPWGPPFRTEASPHWCSTLPIDSYQSIAVILALPVNLDDVVERSTGFLDENIPRYFTTFLEYFQDIPRTLRKPQRSSDAPTRRYGITGSTATTTLPQLRKIVQSQQHAIPKVKASCHLWHCATYNITTSQ